MFINKYFMFYYLYNKNFSFINKFYYLLLPKFYYYNYYFIYIYIYNSFLINIF